MAQRLARNAPLIYGGSLNSLFFTLALRPGDAFADPGARRRPFSLQTARQRQRQWPAAHRNPSPLGDMWMTALSEIFTLPAGKPTL